MNVIELVQEIGRRYGRELSKDDADAILWSKTGFPSFFTTEGTYEEVLTPRLTAFFTQSATEHDPECANAGPCWCDEYEVRPEGWMPDGAETQTGMGRVVPSSEADPEKCYSRPCFCGRCGR